MKRRILSLFLCIIMCITLVPVAPKSVLAADIVVNGDGWHIDSAGKLYITGAVKNPSENENLSPWKDYAHEITEVIALKGASIDNGAYLFCNFQKMTEADLRYLDTSKVTSMKRMFETCINLNTLDISGFVTSNVTNMFCMFSKCNKLTKLDVSSFDTSKAEDLRYMFRSCYYLKNIDVSGFRAATPEVDVTGMFAFCHSLESLDMRDFGGKNIKKSDMLLNCTSLKTITMHIKLIPAQTLIDAVPTLINAETGDIYTTNTQIAALRGTVTLLADEEACNTIRGWYIDENDILHITGQFERYNKVYYGADQINYSYEERFNCDQIKGVIAEKGSSLISGSDLFTNYENVEKIDLSEMDMSKVKSVYNMLNFKEKLTEIDFGTLDITKVESTDHFFIHIPNLIKITADGTLLSQIAHRLDWCSDAWVNEATGKIYRGRGELSTLTGHVTLVRLMKGDGWYVDDNRCLHITGAIHNANPDEDGIISTPWKDVKNIITSVIAEKGASIDNGQDLFADCEKLVSVDLRNLDTSKVTMMDSMFMNCENLKTIQLKGINTSNVTDMSYMFDNCRSLKSLDLSGFVTSKVTNMYSMFAQCKDLADLNFAGFDTKNVTNVSWMFTNCKSLEKLDLSHFNTAKVTDAKLMFSGCEQLKTLDISNFDSKGMKANNAMLDFVGCNQLISITVRKDLISNDVPAQSLLKICPEWKDKITDTLYDSVNKLKNLSGTDVVTLVRNRYTIEFDANGGTGDMSKYNGTVSSAIMIPACEYIPPVGVGFYAEFSGTWILEGDWIPGGSKEWPAGKGVVIEGDTLIKPKWKMNELTPPAGCVIEGRTAKWNKASYAVKYEFSLYTSANVATPVLTMNTTKTQLNLNEIYPAMEPGTYYRFTVRAFMSDDIFSAPSSCTWTFIPYPSLNGQATGVSEEAQVGDVLRVTAPSGVDKSLLYYQWERSADGHNWSVITGESTASYTVKKTDEGKYIRVNVMAEGYIGKQTSKACLIYAKLSGTMQITGVARYGNTLTAVITGSQDANFVYNWYRGSEIIRSSASNQYTPTVEDIGETISCIATAYGSVKGSLTASGVVIKKSVGPAAPTVVAHPATLADDSNGWIEISSGYPIEYSTTSNFASSNIVASGNIYGLTSGVYYLRTATSSWKEAGTVTSVTVGKHTEALAIKPIDPIPFGIAGRFTDTIMVEAIGGTAPYTWEIITQPYFVDAFSKEGFWQNTTINTYYPGKTATFTVQFPDSRGSNLGRMRVRVKDSNGNIAELPITFEGYKANYAFEYPYFFSIEKSTVSDFATKTYTYGYDPISKSEAMIVTLRNECGDEDYPILLSDLTFDATNGNGDVNFDVYIDPAFQSDRLGRYEEVNIYVVPKTGLNASTGWVSGYPVMLTVTHSSGNSSTLNYGSYFLVEPKSLDTCTVEPVPTQFYTGSMITPKLRIYDGVRYLSENDYSVQWSNNIEKGIASFTVTAKEFSYDGSGTGNYTGQISGTFTIVKDETPHTHSGTLYPGIPAICTKAGVKDYYTCSCGKAFEDVTCKIEIANLDAWKAVGGRGYIAATGHGETEVKNAKEKSCTEDGYTGDIWCLDCGEMIKKGSIIVARGTHDFSKCISNNDGTHKVICKDCNVVQSGHDKDSCTYDVGVITKQPTTTTTGIKTFTCSVCGHTKTETIAKLPTAHTHSYATTWSNDATDHWKQCECGEYITGEHAFTWVIDKAATTTETGSKHEECTVCGYKKAAVTIAKLPETHVHNYATAWSNDATNHWHVCECGDKKDIATHTFKWITDKAATTTETGSKHEECTICGYKKAAVTIDKLPETHVHNYATAWSNDATNHWHVCECGDKKDVATHTFKWITDKAATTTEAGSKHEECTVCGYKKAAVTIDKHKEDTKPVDPAVGSIANNFGVDNGTAEKILQVAKDNNISDDTLKITEKVIINRTNDNDINGSVFGLLKAGITSVKKDSMKVKWSKVKGADGYIIYAAPCGKKNKLQRVGTVSAKTTSVIFKKLKKGTYYKFLIIAYKKVGNVEVTMSASKTIHATTTGGKFGVAKSVKINKIGTKKNAKKVTLKKGKSTTVKATEVRQIKNKRIQKHRGIKLESSNPKVAVIKGSKIIAKGKGKCTVYAYAQNGVYSKIAVTVK